MSCQVRSKNSNVLRFTSTAWNEVSLLSCLGVLNQHWIWKHTMYCIWFVLPVFICLLSSCSCREVSQKLRKLLHISYLERKMYDLVLSKITFLWAYGNHFRQLLRDGNSHGWGMPCALTIYPEPSFRAFWRICNCLVGGGNAKWTMSKSWHPCPYQNCLLMASCRNQTRIFAESPWCPSNTWVGQGTESNWTVILNWTRQLSLWTEPDDTVDTTCA